MGELLIHAGGPKTGSTSIQAWLVSVVGELQIRPGITALLDAQPLFVRPLAFRAATPGLPFVCANSFFLCYRAVHDTDPTGLDDLVAELETALDAATREHGAVLLSSESIAGLLIPAGEPFLRGLQRLTSRHTVRLVCYLRPQHTALESRWRQWGYREGAPMSTWVRDQSDHLRYDALLDLVTSIAPDVRCELRLFRHDLLEQGDVIADFASRVLGIAAHGHASEFRTDHAPPLDLAQLLRDAPPALLSDGGAIDSGTRQAWIGEMARRWAIPESPAARRCRDILHRYAWAEFRAGNRDVDARLGWGVPALVPPPDRDDPFPDDELDALDELWETGDDDTQRIAREYLYAALTELAALTAPGR